MFGAGLANHVRCPRFILIPEFHTKIGMKSTLYKDGDWLSVGSKSVLTTDVTEHIRLISTSPSA